MTRSADSFFNNLIQWQNELSLLRAIVLSCGLTEELKWRQPVYTVNNKNVIVLGGFKDNCVISFFKGALLKDEKQILSKPGNHTQSARVVRFTTVKEIDALKDVLKTYIKEAVGNEKKGLQVDFKEKNELTLPAELIAAFTKDPALKKAFENLTPGKRRGYVLYFTQAKQSATRKSRVEKLVPQILKGKGLNGL